MSKIIKDPIYGYIKIERDDQMAIIDCPFFQRLRNIVQTSYVSLYPASLHNRFTHSLGVYFLGKKAGENLVAEIKNKYSDFYEENETDIISICETFILACLLHDVGHAPFSHTGENYFEEGDGTPSIWECLKNEISSDSFVVDSKNRTVGAPHEIMSALLSLKYLLINNNIDKELFARCIIGLKYGENSTLCSIKNCFIGLLNSSTIDVDRLDYLIRDSYMSGYNNTNIDYERLLSAISIKKVSNSFIFCFKKPALSVLENAIIAHDAEKKWIQSNPTILLEASLVEGMIKYTINEYKNVNLSLFSLDALSEDGIGKEDWTVRLLSDIDIVSFCKKRGYHLGFINSYFDRAKRMKPVWKSEAEYKALFEKTFSTNEGGNLKLIEQYFSGFNTLMNQKFLPLINEEFKEDLENQLKEINDAANENELDDFTIERKKTIEKALTLVNKLYELCLQNNAKFEFLIVKANQFSSGFNKEEFKKIEIYFPNLDRYYSIDSVLNVLSNKTVRDKFFYIFVTDELKKKEKKLSNKIIDIIIQFSRECLENV